MTEFEEGMEYDGEEFGGECGLSDFAFEMEEVEEPQESRATSRASSVTGEVCTSSRSMHPSSFSFVPLAPQTSRNNSPTCVAIETTNHSSWECAFAEAFKGLEPKSVERKLVETSIQIARHQPVAGCSAG
mmetsp:Transcript_23830/g.37272  ORF Transcript_23830/g.37272 Transcript_23830/m.37272 type:complete len:130 (+) Transcript_23830:308-697(+)|eukprot:CAMPEP_0184315192 /NCGR_PEP_ID=MMETSP1049-20130417/80642_1 /TAXON_ID=77928 /ORGANISM="Proteomonas sulcata, Strain CCMP704" /LENGTH=129 /DNA_ID=CAMNT_0026633521 /DNA_START=258 /DNA_END=647 /DNA_ORIENTATION=-